MTRTEPWLLLKDGAEALARQRLGELHRQVSATVQVFHNDAAQQVVELHAPAEPGLGAGLFEALIGALTSVVFAPERLVGSAAGAASTAFRDVLVAGLHAAGQHDVSGSYERAPDQLAHVLNDLVAATESSAAQAWYHAATLVPDCLDAFFEAHPDYKQHEFGADTAEWEGWICDQLGIPDPAVANPAAALTEALWRAFHADYHRISAQVRWHDKNVLEQVEFLADMDPAQRDPFLHSMRARNVEGWHRALALWDSDRMAAVAQIPFLALE